MQRILNIITVLLIATQGFGQNPARRTNSQQISNGGKKKLAIFNWSDGCDYKGIYDANQYSTLQLSNTFKLCHGGGNLDIDEYTIAVTPGSTVSVSRIENLESDYQRKINWLKTTAFVPVAYWQQFKNRKIHELEQFYQAHRIGILFYSDPSILKNNSFSINCDEYVNALVSNDENLILKAWLQLTKKLIATHKAGPELMQKYKEQYNSPDRLKWAKYNVMLFGWWNSCANERIEHVVGDERTFSEYHKLFIKVGESNCAD